MERENSKVIIFKFYPQLKLQRFSFEVSSEHHCNLPGIEYSTVFNGQVTRTFAYITAETLPKIANEIWQSQKTNDKKMRKKNKLARLL